MGDSSNLTSALYKWCSDNPSCIFGTSFKPISLPRKESLEKACSGSNRKIWQFIINHVKSENAATSVRRKISMYQQKQNNLIVTDRDNQSRLRTYTSLTHENRFLNQSIVDLTQQLETASCDLTALRSKLQSKKESYSILIMTQHYFKEKKSSYENSIKKFQQYVNDAKHTKAASTTFDSKQASDVANFVLRGLKKYFFELSRTKTSENKHDRAKIQTKIEQLLRFYGAVELLATLEEETKLNMNIFRISEKNNITVDSVNVSQTSIALKQLKISYINATFTVKRLSNTKTVLLTRKTELLHQIGNELQKQNTEVDADLTLQIIEVDIKENVEKQNLEKLKSTVSRLQKSNENLKAENASNYLQYANLQNLQTALQTTQNQVCEFLIQNYMLIHGLKAKSKNLRKSAVETVDTNADTIQKNVENLLNKYSLESQHYFLLSRQGKLARPAIPVSEIGDAKLAAHLHICKFENKDIALNNCIEILDDLHRFGQKTKSRTMVMMKLQSTETKLNRIETRTFCNKKLEILRQILDHVNSEIATSNKNPMFNENFAKNLSNIVNMWAEQPAQFVVDVNIKNRGLKEWISLINVIKRYEN